MASYLSEKLEARVLLDKIKINGWLHVELVNFSVNDRKGNPILSLSKLELGTLKLALKDHRIDFQYLELQDGLFALTTYEGDSVLNLVNVLKPLSAKGTIDTAKSPVWTFQCDNLTLTGMNFRLKNENRIRDNGGMDYNDMDISDINLKMTDIDMAGLSITADIVSLSAKEKSGINLKSFSGMATFSEHGLSVSDLEIDMNESRLSLDLAFDYPELNAFNDFINQVSIHSTLKDIDLSMRDIGYFAPVMFVMDNEVKCTGKMDGTVSDFKVKDFAFNLGHSTHFLGDVSMKGLPDVYATKAQLDITDFEVLPSDVASFAIPGNMTYIPVPKLLEDVGLIDIEGSYSGYYNDFTLDSRINTGLGDLDLNVQINILKDKKLPVYAGDVSGKNIDLGKLLDYPDLGAFDMDAEIQGSGFDEDNLKAFANIWLENLYFKGHHYDRIVLGGDFTLKTFSGRCLVFDEALELAFDGLVDFSAELPKFNFSADLARARFYDMNLSDRGEDMDLEGKFEANFSGIDPDSFKGHIILDSVRYIENRVEYVLNHLELDRRRDTLLGDVIKLRSDYLDADASGNFSMKFLLPQMRDMILSWEEQGLEQHETWSHDQHIDFTFNFKNTDAISDLFLQDLRISNNATVSGSFDTGDEKMKVDGNLDFIKYKFLRTENTNFNFVASKSGFDFNSSIGSLFFNKESKYDTVNNLGLEDIDMVVKVVNDSIGWLVNWDDVSKADSNTGSIEGYLKIPREGHIEASITDATAQVNGDAWQIEPGNFVIIDTNYLDFSHLVIAGRNEKFDIDGRLTKSSSDTLNMQFENWSLDNFSPILSQYSLQMGGKIDGYVGFTYLDGVPKLFTDLSIDSMVFNYVLLGDTRMQSSWLDADKSLRINLQILSPGADEKYKVLNVGGLVYPMDDKRNFDLGITAQNLQLAVISPFLRSFTSDLHGLASGQVKFTGTFAEPVLNGSLKLQRTELKVDYLNVTYSLSNEISFTRDAISFKDIVVYDAYSNKAICSGSLRHHFFRDMYLDVNIKPDNLLAMDLNRYQNNYFYGTAFATGDIHIYGPFNDISIDMDVSTDRGTNVYIPINYSVDVSQSDFIIFTNSEDSSSIQDKYRVVVQGLKMNMGINVNPSANVQIFLPSNMGSIKANGEGNLKLGVDPRGYLKLNGTYVISSGLFTFSFEQLVSKRFEILRGSSIRWDGDLNSARVKIAAVFRTKTNLSGLGITMLDPTSANRKVNVQVKIFMTDNLFNPTLRFSIGFPNLEEQIKQTIYAVLDTSDVALMNQQALSLLILNSFTYSGNSTNSPINSTSILVNSLSNMLSSISNDFDIGLNYIPGDNLSSDEIEVALSTQLFNDRLIIDGNFGVSSEQNTQKTSSIVGDVQVEYKLTPDGRFRVKAFNRTNDISIIQNDVPYTQGIGIFYRKDFDNLKELFSSKKKKKKKKAEEQSDEQDSE